MADGALDELATRVLEAGGADSRVDAQRLADELADDEQAFDALAFSTDGQVLVELDQGTVDGDLAGPIALEVSADGVLSPFGTAAQTAATSPT